MKKLKIEKNKFDSSRISKDGLLLAVALILSVVESFLPPLIPILPYAKIGISNIVLLYVLFAIGMSDGYIILLLKCLAMGIFSANFSAMAWSIPAGLIAFSVMVVMKSIKIFSVVGISVMAGMMHNLTQVLVAFLLVGSSVFVYLPYLILAGGIAGIVTGIVCHMILEVSSKLNLNVHAR